MNLKDMLYAISESPELSTLEFSSCLCFLRLSSLARGYLELFTKDRQSPPGTLPQPIADILACALKWEVSFVHACWATFKGVIWSDRTMPTEDEVTLYNRHALHRGTCQLYPIN